MTHLGTLFGVSLGPGDPGLITRRAWALLKRQDARWTYPVRDQHSDSLALGITRAAGLTPPPGSEPLVFPMTHDQVRLNEAWRNAAERVLAILRLGQDVLFLVEGDASTYSSFGYLSRSLRQLEPSAPIETVAGVTSFSAAAARFSVSLGDADETLAVLPAGYDVATVDALLSRFDTLVLLKVSPRLDEIIALLERRGRLQDALFIEKAGTPDERVIADLGALRGQRVGYMSLVLIKRALPRPSAPPCSELASPPGPTREAGDGR